MRKALALVGMLAVLAFAYGSDRWIDISRTRAAATGDIGASWWIATISHLVWAACLVALARAGTTMPFRSRGISLLLVAIGLAVVLLPAPMVTSYLSGLGFPGLSLAAGLSPQDSLAGLTGVFAIVMGLAAILLSAGPDRIGR
ncbi:MAG TPA: hypothetical protein VGA61_17890 [Anaerolineae bacterium]